MNHEIVNTPSTWESKFNLDKGAILGLSHSFFNVLSFRPATRHSSYKGLYFVGASTHPGTGVPICLAGSKITSEQILDDLGMLYPWTRVDSRKMVTPALDQEKRAPITFEVTMLLILAIVLLALVLSIYQD